MSLRIKFQLHCLINKGICEGMKAVLDPNNAETRFKVHPAFIKPQKTEHKFRLLEITTIKCWEWSLSSEVNSQGCRRDHLARG